MSRDLRPAERRVCGLVFAFLGVMISSFLVLNAIDSLFDRSPPVWKVSGEPDSGHSVGLDPKGQNQSSHFKRNPDPQPQKQWAGDAEQDEGTGVSLANMKARLQQRGAMALERMARFDPQPLEQHVDAQSVRFAEVEPQPDLAESFQIKQGPRGIANAGAEPLLPAPPQEAPERPSERPSAPALEKSEETSTTAQASPEAQVLHIKSRLHELGFLSSARTGGWDASTRNALRDFKVANALPNDDTWDMRTSNKLNSQVAVRADHSIIGDWSTAPCRSAKPDTRLSITSRRSKSSDGSVCEFNNLKATAREWRVQAKCSHGKEHWNANGKFSLSADKLVWTSERDVIDYFRCN